MAEKTPIFQAPGRALEIPTSGLSSLGEAGRMVGRLGNEAAQQERAAGHALDTGLNEVGKGVEAVGNQIQARDNLTDITQGAATFAQAQVALTQQWQAQLAQNPDDPNLAQKFIENNIQPTLDEVSDGFQTEAGRKFAAGHSDMLLQHWGNTLVTGQANAAGEAVKGSIEQTGNALSASVAADPAHLPVALSSLTALHNAAGDSAVLSPEARGALTGPALVAAQKDLINVAAKAAIDKAVENGQDPTAVASSYAKIYGDRLGGDGTEQLTKYGEVRQRTAQVDMAAQQKATQARAQDQSDQHATQYFPQVFGAIQNGTHQLPPNTLSNILHDPSLTDDTKTAFTGAYAKITNGTAADSTAPNTLDDAVAGLLQPKGSQGYLSPTNLIQGVAKGDLSPHDAQTLMNLNPAGLSQLDGALSFGRSYLAPTDPGSGKVDPVRFNQYAMFQRWAIDQVGKGGLPPSDKLPGIVDTFKGYTIVPGSGPDMAPVVSWGANEDFSEGEAAAPKPSLGSFFTGLFGGGKPAAPTGSANWEAGAPAGNADETGKKITGAWTP